MGRRRGTRWLVAAVSATAVSIWLVRRGAAHAHTTGMASLIPQATSREPAQLVDEVRKHAEATGVNPVLLMAILHIESYKPHIPLLERAWQMLHRDSALGVANMHRGAYEQAKRGRPFAERRWKDLADDPGLAVEAAAWHLHDLAVRLDNPTSTFSTDELLAMGYNAGMRNMLRFADGTAPGPQARAYVERLRDNWADALRPLKNTQGQP